MVAKRITLASHLGRFRIISAIFAPAMFPYCSRVSGCIPLEIQKLVKLSGAENQGQCFNRRPDSVKQRIGNYGLSLTLVINLASRRRAADPNPRKEQPNHPERLFKPESFLFTSPSTVK